MSSVPALVDDQEPEVARARRPKWLTLMLLGHLTHEQPIALSTSTFIEVLARLDVSAHAARSTLSRLVESDLLNRQREGRQTFYTLTPHGSRILREGNAQAWRESEREWDGSWTLLAYSIPEERRALRLRLRSRLAWGGFGMLDSGVWIAPGNVDVHALLDGLDVLDDVRVFVGTPGAGASADDLIEEAFDLDRIADRYTRFIRRWSGDWSEAFTDELCAFLVLRSEWQQLVQADPRLPAEHLPPEWPAKQATVLFRDLYRRLEGPATELATQVAGLLSIDHAKA
ncbi:PaaX family transcriptional regulator [Nocardia cyriacigeorgica]|uniref:PaaX family transcriptional regulator n=1 Tax=Nocardia cyriacigeorgica TaxID=135487 RepID=A0A6P1CU08_9NOCA|nr:PaaX family transcriptional regulator C-terminal domain-containing protein [Nocardia cyriacigeorgica]NEW36038.1 PaaX family transcriptional regulator [Nocardia cyriacigeorgica]